LVQNFAVLYLVRKRGVKYFMPVWGKISLPGTRGWGMKIRGKPCLESAKHISGLRKFARDASPAVSFYPTHYWRLPSLGRIVFTPLSDRIEHK
jgi:hypothetical protein